MPEGLSRPLPQYLRTAQIMRRYGISDSTFYRWCHHDDPLRRFPKPRMVIGGRPIWMEADLIAFETARSTPEADPPAAFDLDATGPAYLNKADVARRYAMTKHGLQKLINHPDVTQRFPPPSLIMGNAPYWALVDLDRFDAEQEELSKHRQLQRPVRGRTRSTRSA